MFTREMHEQPLSAILGFSGFRGISLEQLLAIGAMPTLFALLAAAPLSAQLGFVDRLFSKTSFLQVLVGAALTGSGEPLVREGGGIYSVRIGAFLSSTGCKDISEDATKIGLCKALEDSSAAAKQDRLRCLVSARDKCPPSEDFMGLAEADGHVMPTFRIYLSLGYSQLAGLRGGRSGVYKARGTIEELPFLSAGVWRSIGDRTAISGGFVCGLARLQNFRVQLPPDANGLVASYGANATTPTFGWSASGVLSITSRVTSVLEVRGVARRFRSIEWGSTSSSASVRPDGIPRTLDLNALEVVAGVHFRL